MIESIRVKKESDGQFLDKEGIEKVKSIEYIPQFWLSKKVS